MNKIIKISLIVILSLFVIFLGFKFYDNILEPAYFSYSMVCLNVNTEEYGYYQAGNLTIEDDKIKVEVSDIYPKDIQKEVLKHETIHFNQIKNRKIYVTCRNLFFLEIEAYAFQRLPDKIFYILYEEFEENQYCS